MYALCLQLPAELQTLTSAGNTLKQNVFRSLNIPFWPVTFYCLRHILYIVYDLSMHSIWIKYFIFSSKQHLYLKHKYAHVGRKRFLCHANTMIPCHARHAIYMSARVQAHFIPLCVILKRVNMHINHSGSDRRLELAEGWLAAPVLRHIAPLLNDGKSVDMCGCLCVFGREEMMRKNTSKT